MTFHIIIPARYQSTRLPGKLLLPLKDKPILQWVYETASESSALSVSIATDHPAISDAARSFGASVIMTDPAHESGTDRLSEAAQKLGLVGNECIVNIQGDEPFISVDIIEQLAQGLHRSDAPMATLCAPLTERIPDPNVVKVVFNQNQQAIYFSRAVIPHQRDPHDASPEFYKHIGVYAYRANFLQQYVSWGPCALELTERLEQLRVLWHGYPIQMVVSDNPPVSDINTKEDYERALRHFG